MAELGRMKLMLGSEVSLDLAEIIRASLGEKRVDLLLKNARLVNVLSGEIYQTDVAIDGGLVVGFGDYEAVQVVDLIGLAVLNRVCSCSLCVGRGGIKGGAPRPTTRNYVGWNFA